MVGIIIHTIHTRSFRFIEVGRRSTMHQFVVSCVFANYHNIMVKVITFPVRIIKRIIMKSASILILFCIDAIYCYSYVI